MRKIVFFNIPAYGHTNPTLGVVRELISRGHAVRYYSYERFRDKIEAVGAEFIACDAYDNQLHLSAEDGAKIGQNLSFSIKVLVRTALALDDAIMQDMLQYKPDCIVADSMALWGKWIAAKLGVPFISSTTTFAFNRYSAQIMPKESGQLWQLLKATIINRTDLKALRRKGYPVRGILSLLQNDNDTNTIVYTSEAFQPCAETFSDKYSFVGAVLDHISLEQKPHKKKLIYISMGTVNHDFPEFYQNCIEAFRNTDYLVVISAGENTDLSAIRDIPRHIRVYASVNQTEILQTADVFLTHCGMNSVSESLYYNVPLVMFPQTNEQKGVAQRTFDIGAGIYLNKTTPEHILQTVETILNNAVYQRNANAIGQTLRESGGARKAADTILQTIK